MPFHIGPHIPLERTLLETVEFMNDSKSNLIQTFQGPPISYNLRRFTEENLLKTGDYLKETKTKLYTHAPYVINLASQDEVMVMKGSKCLLKILENNRIIETAAGKKKTGTVLHIGAKGSVNDVIVRLNDLTMGNEISTMLYLENAAQKGKLGKDLSELKKIQEELDSSKVGFCIDTCHAHSNGSINMKNPESILRFFEELDEKNVVIHLNDSKTPFSSGQDRHAILGHGTIWEKDNPYTWESLFFLRDYCKENGYDIILETPSENIEEYEYNLLF